MALRGVNLLSHANQWKQHRIHQLTSLLANVHRRNVIHGSDSVENGKKEIALWFPEGLNEWTPALTPWIKE